MAMMETKHRDKLTNMMYYVYILENDTGGHYIGSSESIETRLKRHNQNSVRSTKNKGPFKVVYKEAFNTKTEARQRENEFKKYKSIRYLKDLLKIPDPIV